MISVGGNSYNNGIRFVSLNYNISFNRYSDTTKIVLRKNLVTQGRDIEKVIQKIPLLRGILTMLQNFKEWSAYLLFVLFLDIIQMNKKQTETGTLTFAICFIIISILIWSFLIVKILKNVKSTFEYHGAEHKVIYVNYENQELTLENCRKAPRISYGCGTMFVCMLLFVFVIMQIFQAVLNFDMWISIKYILIFCIANELFLMDADTPVVKWLYKLGYWLQEHIFTREPSDEKLYWAIVTFQMLEKAEKGEIPEEVLNDVLKNGIVVSDNMLEV